MMDMNRVCRRILVLRRVARGGFSVVEMSVALVVLAAAMLALVQTVAVVGRQRQLAERMALATQETGNLMERLHTWAWDDLTPERAAALRLSDACRDRLPDPQLKVSVEPAGEVPRGKQVHIELDWRESHGGRSLTIRRTAWRYEP
jgi:hypothetical protein